MANYVVLLLFKSVAHKLNATLWMKRRHTYISYIHTALDEKAAYIHTKTFVTSQVFLQTLFTEVLTRPGESVHTVNFTADICKSA